MGKVAVKREEIMAKRENRLQRRVVEIGGGENRDRGEEE